MQRPTSPKSKSIQRLRRLAGRSRRCSRKHHRGFDRWLRGAANKSRGPSFRPRRRQTVESHCHARRLGEFTIPMPVGIRVPSNLPQWQLGKQYARLWTWATSMKDSFPHPQTLQLNWTANGGSCPTLPRLFNWSSFDDSSWGEIDVPAHWVMQGYQAQKGQGGYRRHVQIPSTWRGRRIRIAFDGVYSGAEVWWNGHRVGSHMGGATPFQLDVTDAASPGGDNVIAVRVSERLRSLQDG